MISRKTAAGSGTVGSDNAMPMIVLSYLRHSKAINLHHKAFHTVGGTQMCLQALAGQRNALFVTSNPMVLHCFLMPTLEKIINP